MQARLYTCMPHSEVKTCHELRTSRIMSSLASSRRLMTSTRLPHKRLATELTAAAALTAAVHVLLTASPSVERSLRLGGLS